MKRKLIVSFFITLLVVALLCLASLERYQNAVYWIDEGGFSKATPYVDEFPFIIELYDPGFVSYAYAGEEMEYGHYAEAIELLKPLAERNYRDSVQMLNDCMEKVAQLPN